MEPAELTVMGIARGYQLSQTLYVAAKLGVADGLAAEPLAAEAYAGGRERTEAEFTRLVDRAGLRLATTTGLKTGPRLLDAVAV